MANYSNIAGHKYTSDQNREEASKNGKKGGVASGKARREKRSLKEALLGLLNDTYQNKKGETASGYEIMMLGLFKRAQDGDPKAVKLVAELIGEYKQSVDVTGTITAPEIVVSNPATAEKLKNILKKGSEE